MSKTRESKPYSLNEVVQGLTEFHSMPLIESAKLLLAHNLQEEINFLLRGRFASNEEVGKLYEWIDANYPGYVYEAKVNDEKMQSLTAREKIFLYLVKTKNCRTYIIQAAKEDKLASFYVGNYYKIDRSPPDLKEAKKYFEQSQHPLSVNQLALMLEQEKKYLRLF